MSNRILPQWQIDQAREMDRRLFDHYMQLANIHAWQAQHGPVAERSLARVWAGVYLSRAMAFSRTGGE